MGFLDKMKSAANDATKFTGMGTGMGVGDQRAYQQLAMKLNQSGVNRTAVVTSMTATGNSDMGGSEEMRFEVEVRPEGGDPYAASFTQFVAEGAVRGVAEGSSVTVRVDPDDPTAMLFWGSA